MSEESSNEALVIEAFGFHILGEPADEWRNNAELRVTGRRKACALIADLARCGITVTSSKVGDRKNLAEFCTDLRTHPARAAYGEDEVTSSVPKEEDQVVLADGDAQAPLEEAEN